VRTPLYFFITNTPCAPSQTSNRNIVDHEDGLSAGADCPDRSVPVSDDGFVLFFEN